MLTAVELMKTKFQALLFNGFDELDFFGVFEPLRMGGFEVSTLSLHKQDFITSAHGVKVIPDFVHPSSHKADVLLVPGGGWISRSEQGAYAEVQKGTIVDAVKDFKSAGVILASVCTGALVLGNAGLLKGRPATTNRGAVKELLDCGANYVDARVVDDGDIVTAAGITASLDLGLWLLERFGSQEAALKVSKGLEFERRGIVSR